jgi:hypothetical protein
MSLKVFVKAEGFSETEQMLHQFKEALPSGASIAHLNIKTSKDNDWFAQGSVLQQTQNLDSFGERLKCQHQNHHLEMLSVVALSLILRIL